MNELFRPAAAGDVTTMPAQPVQHADGVYFGMPEDEYHADPALGSSNLKDLLTDPAEFWWKSSLNPMREEQKESLAKTIGKAVHTFVLDGPDAFGARYGRCQHPGNIKAGIAERNDFAAQGKIPLKASDYDRAVMAATMIRANPHIGGAFDGGMSEVSVFWTDKVDDVEVRRKARFDFLRVRAVVDLKTHAPMEGVSFKASCLRSIKTYSRAIQARAYLDARSVLPRLVADGAVHGDHDPKWLGEVAAAHEFAFVLIFWRSEGPPLTWGATLSPTHPRLMRAMFDIERALRRYAQFRAEFGADAMWVKAEPLAELDDDEVENWFRIDSAA